MTQPQQQQQQQFTERSSETSPLVWYCWSKDAATHSPSRHSVSVWATAQRPAGRIDSAEVSDVFLPEGAVITGIFYRQERDIYTADVRDDRGEGLFSRMTGPFSIPEGSRPDMCLPLALLPFYFVSFPFVLTTLFRSSTCLSSLSFSLSLSLLHRERAGR